MYVYRNTIKCTKRCKQSSAIKRLLETLFLAIMAELRFHRFVHLIVFRYIFSAFTTSSVLAIRRTSLL